MINIQWSRLSHCKVGGVTEARGTSGTSVTSPRICLEPDVRRSLGHILKYSIRPKVCDPDTTLEHYGTSDLLSLSSSRRPILYPTYMSRTGWGLRKLNEDELSLCFELPSYLSWEDRFLKCILPLQLFRSVIDFVINQSDVNRVSTKRVSTIIEDEVVSPPTAIDACWIPSISKWLPGSWSLAEIASEAVKSDDAPVDFTPWHRRIQLVLPCSDDNIAVLERFSTRRWRRNVCHSLFRFLRHAYGDSCYDASLNGGGSDTSGLFQPLAKRSKSSNASMASLTERGGGFSIGILFWT